MGPPLNFKPKTLKGSTSFGTFRGIPSPQKKKKQTPTQTPSPQPTNLHLERKFHSSTRIAISVLTRQNQAHALHPHLKENKIAEAKRLFHQSQINLLKGKLFLAKLQLREFKKKISNLPEHRENLKIVRGQLRQFSLLYLVDLAQKAHLIVAQRAQRIEDRPFEPGVWETKQFQNFFQSIRQILLQGKADTLEEAIAYMKSENQWKNTSAEILPKMPPIKTDFGIQTTIAPGVTLTDQSLTEIIAQYKKQNKKKPDILFDERVEPYPYESIVGADGFWTLIGKRFSGFKALWNLETEEGLKKLAHPNPLVGKKYLLEVAKKLRSRNGSRRIVKEMLEGLFEPHAKLDSAKILPKIKKEVETQRSQAQKEVQKKLVHLKKSHPQVYKKQFGEKGPDSKRLQQLVEMELQTKVKAHWQQLVFKDIQRQYESRKLLEKDPFAFQAWEIYKDAFDPFEHPLEITDESWDAGSNWAISTIPTLPFALGVGSLIRTGLGVTGTALRMAAQQGVGEVVKDIGIIGIAGAAEGVVISGLSSSLFRTEFSFKTVGIMAAMSWAYHYGGAFWLKIAARTKIGDQAILAATASQQTGKAFALKGANFSGSMAMRTAIATTFGEIEELFHCCEQGKIDYTFWQRVAIHFGQQLAIHGISSTMNFATGNYFKNIEQSAKIKGEMVKHEYQRLLKLGVGKQEAFEQAKQFAHQKLPHVFSGKNSQKIFQEHLHRQATLIGESKKLLEALKAYGFENPEQLRQTHLKNPKALRNKYKAFCRQYHPDLNPGQREKFEYYAKHYKTLKESLESFQKTQTPNPKSQNPKKPVASLPFSPKKPEGVRLPLLDPFIRERLKKPTFPIRGPTSTLPSSLLTTAALFLFPNRASSSPLPLIANQGATSLQPYDPSASYAISGLFLGVSMAFLFNLIIPAGSFQRLGLKIRDWIHGKPATDETKKQVQEKPATTQPKILEPRRMVISQEEMDLVGYFRNLDSPIGNLFHSDIEALSDAEVLDLLINPESYTTDSDPMAKITLDPETAEDIRDWVQDKRGFLAKKQADYQALKRSYQKHPTIRSLFKDNLPQGPHRVRVYRNVLVKDLSTIAQSGLKTGQGTGGIPEAEQTYDRIREEEERQRGISLPSRIGAIYAMPDYYQSVADQWGGFKGDRVRLEFLIDPDKAYVVNADHYSDLQGMDRGGLNYYWEGAVTLREYLAMEPGRRRAFFLTPEILVNENIPPSQIRISSGILPGHSSSTQGIPLPTEDEETITVVTPPLSFQQGRKNPPKKPVIPAQVQVPEPWTNYPLDALIEEIKTAIQSLPAELQPDETMLNKVKDDLNNFKGGRPRNNSYYHRPITTIGMLELITGEINTATLKELYTKLCFFSDLCRKDYGGGTTFFYDFFDQPTQIQKVVPLIRLAIVRRLLNDHQKNPEVATTHPFIILARRTISENLYDEKTGELIGTNNLRNYPNLLHKKLQEVEAKLTDKIEIPSPSEKKYSSPKRPAYSMSQKPPPPDDFDGEDTADLMPDTSTFQPIPFDETGISHLGRPRQGGKIAANFFAVHARVVELRHAELHQRGTEVYLIDHSHESHMREWTPDYGTWVKEGKNWRKLDPKNNPGDREYRLSDGQLIALGHLKTKNNSWEHASHRIPETPIPENKADHKNTVTYRFHLASHSLEPFGEEHVNVYPEPNSSSLPKKGPTLSRKLKKLRTMAQDPLADIKQRREAIKELGRLKDLAFREFLYDRLRDTTPENQPLRAAAAYALGLMGDPGAGPVLREIGLNQKSDPSLLKATIVALGRLKNATSIPILQKIVEQPNQWATDLLAQRQIRELALESLGEIGGKTVGEFLQSIVQDPEKKFSEEDKRKAIVALGMIKDETAKILLVEVLQFKHGASFELEKAALFALGRLGDNNAIEQLKNFLRRQNFGSNHEPLPLQLQVIFYLGYLENRSVKSTLEKVARDKTLNNDLRQAARIALRNLKISIEGKPTKGGLSPILPPTKLINQELQALYESASRGNKAALTNLINQFEQQPTEVLQHLKNLAMSGNRKIKKISLHEFEVLANETELPEIFQALQEIAMVNHQAYNTLAKIAAQDQNPLVQMSAYQTLYQLALQENETTLVTGQPQTRAVNILFTLLKEGHSPAADFLVDIAEHPLQLHLADYVVKQLIRRSHYGSMLARGALKKLARSFPEASEAVQHPWYEEVFSTIEGMKKIQDLLKKAHQGNEALHQPWLDKRQLQDRIYFGSLLRQAKPNSIELNRILNLATAKSDEIRSIILGQLAYHIINKHSVKALRLLLAIDEQITDTLPILNIIVQASTDPYIQSLARQKLENLAKWGNDEAVQHLNVLALSGDEKSIDSLFEAGKWRGSRKFRNGEPIAEETTLALVDVFEKIGEEAAIHALYRLIPFDPEAKVALVEISKSLDGASLSVDSGNPSPQELQSIYQFILARVREFKSFSLQARTDPEKIKVLKEYAIEANPPLMIWAIDALKNLTRERIDGALEAMIDFVEEADGWKYALELIQKGDKRVIPLLRERAKTNDKAVLVLENIYAHAKPDSKIKAKSLQALKAAAPFNPVALEAVVNLDHTPIWAMPPAIQKSPKEPSSE